VHQRGNQGGGVTIRFAVLGSGSAGNACLLEMDGRGLLIDAGLGPQALARRMAAVGASWDTVDAAILTHTHTDHWRERSLALLVKHEVTLYCHGSHASWLRRRSAAFTELEAAGLVRHYRADAGPRLWDELQVRPVPLSHDGGATFGFRFEREASLFARPWSMAYAADLGTWDERLVPALADVDLLAVEFNHDVHMQRHSGRPPFLVSRVLGDQGHLSNEQAAALLGEAIGASRPGRLRDVVQLHLSRQCNRPRLAASAATGALERLGAQGRIHTASQCDPLCVTSAVAK
jgi:phosphoribosyl 1,2-cyclic phosphodiesterase